MVPAETIVEQALQLKPDVIGLSGLITPSLEEMVATVHLLGRAGIHVPIMIGGATTSPLHTALKIAPAYEGPVIHVCDASQNAPMAAPFLDPATAEEARTALAAEQAALRQQAQRDDAPPTSTLEQARERKPHFF
jgi:5-methyltetrahydrofolate--homocysteine methyltransferase